MSECGFGHDAAKSLPELFVLGDSISIHYHPHLAACLKNVARVNRKSSHPAGCQAVAFQAVPRCESNGGDSRLVLEFLKSWASNCDCRCDVLVVNCGLHDVRRDRETRMHQVPIVEYECNLVAIVEAARKVSGRIFWVRTTPVDDRIHAQRGAHLRYTRSASDVERYNCVADRVMRHKGISLIDLDPVSSDWDRPVYLDHVHFSPEVRRSQACFIGGVVSCYLSLRFSKLKVVS